MKTKGLADFDMLRFWRRGRPCVVAGKAWRYKVGKGGHVIAYSDQGERRCTHASEIKGCTPDTFDRGKYKKTSDGMLMPHEVEAWLRRKEKS